MTDSLAAMFARDNLHLTVLPTIGRLRPTDARTRFYLNQNAKWHDGGESPPTMSNSRSMRSRIRTLVHPIPKLSGGDGVLAGDRRAHVRDRRKEPLFTFLYDLFGVVVPKHIWESVPIADWRTDGGATGQDPSRVVGSGPWKFQEWRQGESISFVRNDDYYQKVPTWIRT